MAWSKILGGSLAPFNRMYFLGVAITSFIRNKWLIEHVSIRPLFAKEPNGPFLEQLCQAELVPDAGHIMNQDHPAKIDSLILNYIKT
jgi:hypothetical protein